MPVEPGQMPVECADCGAHFQVDPSGDIAGSACSECGGKRFFRSQPSPTESDGTLRNMPDAAGDPLAQQDTGGFPLDEGTIMHGDGGVRPGRGGLDGYTHSKVAAPPNMIYEHSDIPEGLSLTDYRQSPHEQPCPVCGEAVNDPMGFAHHVQTLHPEVAQNGSQTVAKRIEPMHTLNTEPYAPLWDESYLPKTAGPLAEMAAPLLEGGAGELGGLAMGGLKKLMPSAITHLMAGALGGGGQQSGSMAPQMPTPAPSMEMVGSADIPRLLVADYDTPHSVKSIGEQHDDPEHQDQKEFNDGDDSPSNLKNPNNEDSGASGEDGVRDATPGYGFGENSPGIERAMMILPLLLHYFETGDGQSDPLIRGLHDALEQEQPGYLENKHPDGENAVQLIIQQHKEPKSVHAGMNAFPSGLPETPMAGSGMQAPGQGGGTCPTCGGTLAGDGSCPQCGMKQHPMGGSPNDISNTAYGAGGASYPPNRMGNAQGPVTKEQKDVLHQAIDQMPYLFGDVLNAIQKQPNSPPLVDPSQAQPTPAPMPGMMNPPGGMPVTDPSQMGGGGGMPMQPMAKSASPLPQTTQDWHNWHPDDQLEQGKSNCPRCLQPALSKLLGNCSNCGYQIADGGNQSEYDINHPEGRGYTMEHDQWNPDDLPRHWGSADNHVPRCPACDSATTSLMDGIDGDGQQKGQCHACGATFGLNEKKSHRVVKTDLVNPALQNAAEQHEQRPESGEDSSLVWKDKSGQPIIEGQIYSLYTPGIPAPDEVRVLRKKPDALDLKLVGEFSNINTSPDHPDITVTPQQMQSSGYQFVPSGDPQQDPEQPLGGMPGLEQIPQSPQTTDEAANSYPNPGTVSSVLVASEDEVEMDEDLCHKCGGTWISHVASSSTRTMHECARCGSAWETVDNDQGREAGADLNWLYDSNNADDFYAGMERARSMSEYGQQSRSLAAAVAKDEKLQMTKDLLEHNKDERQRLAGRHFTPGEQRALINERGTARNADLLDLSNTHYEARWDATGRANEENVPDSHMILGL